MKNNLEIKIRNYLLKSLNNSDKIFNIGQDYDLSSLYPSLISAFNICAETCLGKITYRDNSTFLDDTENFMDHYMAKDGILFCNEYLNLPNIIDIINIIDRKYYPING